jgi:Xaa-Pro aminopeptidase
MPVPAERDPRMPRLTLSPGFIRTMQSGWGEADRTPRLSAGTAHAAAAHRDRLSAALPGRRIAVGAGRAPMRANDSAYDFRANSDFLWLTGVAIEDAVIVLEPVPGGHDATLHLPAPFRPGDDGFFGSALHGELWVGPIPGLAEYADALGVRTRPIEELTVDAGTLCAGAGVLDQPRSAELSTALSELRMFKDDWEIAELRAAIEGTVDGFAATVREIPAAVRRGGERWLQGTFDRHARTVGNGPGYTTIVGSGAHAPILHWVRADGEIDPEALLLLDMGVERNSGYTADVTRTFPASGRFTPVQRQVHDLVERSHRAGLAAVAPGRPWSDFHVASMEVLAQGLHDWGLLDVSVDEALSADGQQHRRYIVCGVGHHLGIDVHDCSASSYAAYQGSTMQEGMVLTVEPGLYFHSFDETLPPELRGIGVRLEDDLLVTAAGTEIISDGLPIDADGVESWMSGLDSH